MLKTGLARLTLQNRQVANQPAPPGWRRLFHLVAGSAIPLAAIFSPENAMVAATAALSGGGLGLDLLRFRVGWLNQQFLRWLFPLLKQEEGNRVTGATYLVLGALLAFLLFGSDIAVAVLLFLSLGDPAAAVVGRRMAGYRIRGKSPGGTVAFVLVALVVVGALTASGAVDYHWGLLAGALVAGLVELISVPPDDNLAIPLLAGAAMYFIGV